MPLALFGLAAVIAFLWKEKSSHATPGMAPQVLPVMSMAQLQPGAATYLPPIAAPDWVRVTYANAMASANQIQMASAAQQLQQAGYPELAHALSLQYQQITNNPIPGVAGVGAFGTMANLPGQLHAPTVAALAHAARQRRHAMQYANLHRYLLSRAARPLVRSS